MQFRHGRCSTIKFQASPETQPVGITLSRRLIQHFLPALGAKKGRRVSSFTQEKDESGAKVGSEDRAKDRMMRLKRLRLGCEAVEITSYISQ